MTNQHKQSIPPKEFLSKNPSNKSSQYIPPKNLSQTFFPQKFLSKHSSYKIFPRKIPPKKSSKRNSKKKSKKYLVGAVKVFRFASADNKIVDLEKIAESEEFSDDEESDKQEEGHKEDEVGEFETPLKKIEAQKSPQKRLRIPKK